MKYDGFYAIVDIETGGLSKEKNPICEICIILVNNKMEEVERYQTLIKNYNNGTYTKEAYEVHGIPEDELQRDGKDAKVVIDEITKLFKKYTPHWLKRPILVGHNMISFDAPYIASMFEYFKKDFWSTVNTYIADTMWLSRDKWGHVEKPNHQLRTSCQEVGIELINGHRAEADTEATYKLFKYFMSCLREENSQTYKTVKQETKIEKNKDKEEVNEVRKFRDGFEF